MKCFRGKIHFNTLTSLTGEPLYTLILHSSFLSLELLEGGGVSRQRKMNCENHRAARWEMRPPRKVRSANLWYTKENYKDHKEILHTNQPQIIVIYLAEKWRKMPNEQRAKWVKLETEDKVRYQNAKIAWAQQFRRIPKLRKKRKDAPVRTRNPFIWFEKDVWSKIKDEHKEWTQQQVVKECCTRWKEMDEISKLPYVQQAEQDKVRYATETADYRRQVGRLEADRRLRNFEARWAALKQRKEIIREEQGTMKVK